VAVAVAVDTAVVKSTAATPDVPPLQLSISDLGASAGASGSAGAVAGTGAGAPSSASSTSSGPNTGRSAIVYDAEATTPSERERGGSTESGSGSPASFGPATSSSTTTAAAAGAGVRGAAGGVGGGAGAAVVLPAGSSAAGLTSNPSALAASVVAVGADASYSVHSIQRNRALVQRLKVLLNDELKLNLYLVTLFVILDVLLDFGHFFLLLNILYQIYFLVFVCRWC
jgi:hypothetical protein